MVERLTVNQMVVGSSPTFGVQPSNSVTVTRLFVTEEFRVRNPILGYCSLGQIAKPPVLDTGVSECESRREHKVSNINGWNENSTRNIQPYKMDA